MVLLMSRCQPQYPTGGTTGCYPEMAYVMPKKEKKKKRRIPMQMPEYGSQYPNLKSAAICDHDHPGIYAWKPSR